MKTEFLDFARNIKHQFLNKRALWTIALYKVQNEREIFEIERREPFAFIGERGIRLSRKYQSTVADPFFLSHNNRIFIFYEVKTDFSLGEIHAASIDDKGIREPYGCVLRESFHLSYPQVFSHDGQIWMIPETASDKRIWLYRCAEFPTHWVRERALINEELVDPSLIMNANGFYILGTTRLPELKLFYSSSLEQTFSDAGVSITKDKSICRNAGTPVRIDGKLLRFAQDGTRSYGENINVLEVTDLSERSYSEVPVIRGLFKNRRDWMAFGCHHISIVPYENEFLVAVDGMGPDRLINNFTLAGLKACGSRDG